MADTVDVLIVSPLATVRAGLAALLAAADGLQVVGEAVSLESVTASDLVPEVGVVLLDAPSAEEIDDAVSVLDGVGPGLVVLGPPSAGGRLPLAAPTFAWGFLARDAGPERIVAAVRAVAAGLVAFEPELASAPLGQPGRPAPERRRDRRPDGARARGADAGRHRADQQGDRPAPDASAITRSSSTSRRSWRSSAPRAAPRPSTSRPGAAC